MENPWIDADYLNSDPMSDQEKMTNSYSHLVKLIYVEMLENPARHLKMMRETEYRAAVLTLSDTASKKPSGETRIFMSSLSTVQAAFTLRGDYPHAKLAVLDTTSPWNIPLNLFQQLQENGDSLFHQTDICCALFSPFYVLSPRHLTPDPLDQMDITRGSAILTHDVKIMRDFSRMPQSHRKPTKCYFDVISMAPAECWHNRSWNRSSFTTLEKYQKEAKQTIKSLFCTLPDGDYEVIVLPAMGLDRLFADVKTIVDTFHDELTSDMFRGKSKVVCFAIPESSSFAAENMKAFRERFEDPGWTEFPHAAC